MNSDADALMTNPSLLLRLRDVQDRKAWALFVEVYGPLIISYCQRKQLQDSDAADVSQEVLKSLCKSLRGFEYQPERGRFRDWLGKVTHREILQFWKRQRRMVSTESTEQEACLSVEDSRNWDHHFHSELLQTAVQRIRREFEEDTWGIFVQLWFEEKPPGEVAAAFGTSVGSAYVAKSRVLKRLRTEVLMLSDDLPVHDRAQS